MEQKPDKHLKTGQLGENMAVKHLNNLGFKILGRNYWKPYGEIDIVAYRGNCIHFVEVKTVTRSVVSLKPTKFSQEERLEQVNYETLDQYEPEDNMHLWKRQRLSRVIEAYLQEKGGGEDSDWQVDLLSVYLDEEGNLMKIDCLEDIILE